MRSVLFLLLAFGLAASVRAQTIGLRLETVTAQVGDTVEVALFADTTLTGRGVLAYRVGFTFNQQILTPLAVEAAGTLSSGASVTPRLLPGRVEVAAASAQPLAGTGRLLRLRFRVTAPGWSGLHFDRPFTYLNEGSPAVSFTDGTVSVAYPPNLYVSNNAELVPGETRALGVSGGTAPYAWRSETPSVATVTAEGQVAALAPGTARVVARDANGYEIGADVVVRAFEVRVGTTAESSVGDTVRVPLLLAALGAPGASAGQIGFTYNGQALDVLGLETTGTLLAGAQVELARSTNAATVAFASATPLSADGTLLHLVVRVKTPGGHHIDLQSARFDERLVGRLADGTVPVRYPSQLWVYAPQTRLVAGESLQLQLSGAAGAVTFTLSDTSLASISEDGLLRAKKGGRLVVTAEDPTGAKVSTNPIDLYDTRLRVQVPSIAAGDQGGVVLALDPLPDGRTLSSLQADLTFTTSILQVVGSTAPAGVQAAYRVENGKVTLAVAAAQPLASGPLATVFVAVAPGTTGQTASLQLSAVTADEGALRLLPVDATLVPATIAQTSLTPVLTWMPLTGTNTYQVQIALQGTFGSSGKAQTVVLDTVVTGASLAIPAGVLAPGTAYEWRLRDAEVASAPWQPARAFETRPAPAAVQLLAPASGAVGVARPVTLSWQPRDGAIHYDLQVGRRSLDTLVVDVQVTEATFLAEALAAGTPYVWRVRVVTADGVGAWSETFQFSTQVVVGADVEDAADAFELAAPWPSPARNTVRVRYGLPAGQTFSLRLYDATGRLVETLAAGTARGGAQTETVDVSGLPSGVYLLRLVGSGVQTQPLVVVR